MLIKNSHPPKEVASLSLFHLRGIVFLLQKYNQIVNIQSKITEKITKYAQKHISYTKIILYLCSMMFIQGISIIRNVIAVAATFAAIFGLMATILQYGLKLATRNKTITTRQEAAILIIAVLTALLLIPFYYLPG